MIAFERFTMAILLAIILYIYFGMNTLAHTAILFFSKLNQTRNIILAACSVAMIIHLMLGTHPLFVFGIWLAIYLPIKWLWHEKEYSDVDWHKYD